MTTHTLVLASRSPRRHQLLREAGFIFVAHSEETAETLDLRLGLDQAIMEVAAGKAHAIQNFARTIPRALVLSSDTLVVLNGEVLGKPRDETEAHAFLTRLSAQTHEVKTAIHLWDVERDIHDANIETSRVTFRSLSEQEIKNYIQTGEPMDKAGAYGIQGPGGQFINKLEGNLDNVMGLSITLLNQMLGRRKWNVK